MIPSPTPSPMYLVAGAQWDSTYAAAVIAGIVAGLTLLWTFASWVLTRNRLSKFEKKTLEMDKISFEHQKAATDREQHRRELNDGIGYVLGKGKASQAIGFSMLEQLKGATWATDDDRLRVVQVLDAIVSA